MKNRFLSFLSLSSVLLLVACQPTTPPTESSSSSSAASSSESSSVASSSSEASSESSSSATSSSSAESSSSEAPSTSEVTLDVAAIQSGDYSSLVGTWSNASGTQVLTFDENGLVSADGNTLSFESSTIDENGILTASVLTPSGIGGYLIKFAPAGTTFPLDAAGASDASDNSQDRLWGGQQINYADPDAFLYRVN